MKRKEQLNHTQLVNEYGNYIQSINNASFVIYINREIGAHIDDYLINKNGLFYRIEYATNVEGGSF